jgi:hypothetical protein
VISLLHPKVSPDVEALHLKCTPAKVQTSM